MWLHASAGCAIAMVAAVVTVAASQARACKKLSPRTLPETNTFNNNLGCNGKRK